MISDSGAKHFYNMLFIYARGHFLVNCLIYIPAEAIIEYSYTEYFGIKTYIDINA